MCWKYPRTSNSSSFFIGGSTSLIETSLIVTPNSQVGNSNKRETEVELAIYHEISLEGILTALVSSLLVGVQKRYSTVLVAIFDVLSGRPRTTRG